MDSCYFSIDKKVSLDIIKEIQKKIIDNRYPRYCYKHKLALVELGLDSANQDNNIKDFYNEIIEKSNKNDYNRSEDIEIYEINITEFDEIDLDSYLIGTSVECDTSYPKFSYNESLKTWVICDDFWSAKNGIDDNGIVYILDFNNYK